MRNLAGRNPHRCSEHDFFVSYLLLFAGMSRRPNLYDEGIVLTAAMRVTAGQVPHRDFYFLYGPAQLYLLAGLYKLFGQSLLAERLFDLLVKALVVTSVYAFASSYCRKWIAAVLSITTVLWLFGYVYGSPIVPVSLLNVVSSALVLLVFVGRVSRRRMLAAGAVSGAAALFRYDTGMALMVIHICVVLIAVRLRFKGSTDGLRASASHFGPYLLGFALLTIPPAIYYLSVAPLAAILHDIVLFPARYYHSGRNLPFPGIDLNGLENLGVYLPIAIAGMSLYAVIGRRLQTHSGEGLRFPSIHQDQKLQGFLLTFSLLLVVMYLKGFVRVSPTHMYLSIVPSLLLIGVLLQHRNAFATPARILITCLMWLSLVAGAWSALHQMILLRLQHLSVAERILSPPGEAQTAWCNSSNPLTEGLCFLPEEYRIHAIEYIAGHTSADQLLYSGLTDHGRIVENDNLIYFATQRLPATRWSQLDPDLETRYDIQAQMMRELERNVPPYIVIDSVFDSIREPNDSAQSSGIKLLDEYIQGKYSPVETFGTMLILQRKSPK